MICQLLLYPIGLQTNLTEGIDLVDTAEQIANTQSQQESLLITQDSSIKLSKEDLEGHGKGMICSIDFVYFSFQRI